MYGLSGNLLQRFNGSAAIDSIGTASDNDFATLAFFIDGRFFLGGWTFVLCIVWVASFFCDGDEVDPSRVVLGSGHSFIGAFANGWIPS